MTQNENTGVLFSNQKKSDKQPDYRGKLNVNGKEFEIAGWLKDTKNGDKFLSLKIQEPREKKENLPF